MATIPHLLLALALTTFLAVQAGALLVVLRSRRALAARRMPRRTELLWSALPVAVVLFLAIRSWLAVIEVERPASASVVTAEPTRSDPSLSRR